MPAVARWLPAHTPGMPQTDPAPARELTPHAPAPVAQAIPADLDAGLGHQQLQGLTLAPVRAVGMRSLHTVDAATDVVSVERLFRAECTTQVLVRGAGLAQPGLGIFTTSGLQRVILDGRPMQHLAVGPLASLPLLAVGLDTPIYDAPALIIRHRLQRLVLPQGDSGPLLAASIEADGIGVRRRPIC